MSLVMVLMLLGFTSVAGRVKYKCFFGPMESYQDANGVEVRFCRTGLDPPAVVREQYIVARNASPPCYECVCEDSFGLACCELLSCPPRSV